MKIFVFTFLISGLLPSVALAQLCEVYGISDSPQTLNCQFPGEKLTVTCLKGKYLLNQEAVEVAYHLEVETGPVPLVFKSQQSTLTIQQMRGQKFTAQLNRKNTEISGSCRALP